MSVTRASLHLCHTSLHLWYGRPHSNVTTSVIQASPQLPHMSLRLWYGHLHSYSGVTVSVIWVSLQLCHTSLRLWHGHPCIYIIRHCICDMGVPWYVIRHCIWYRRSYFYVIRLCWKHWGVMKMLTTITKNCLMPPSEPLPRESSTCCSDYGAGWALGPASFQGGTLFSCKGRV